jgi:hypothetical protein
MDFSSDLDFRRQTLSDLLAAMSYFYYVACKPCRRFVDLGAWRIFHELRFPPVTKNISPGAGNVAAVKIQSSELQKCLLRLDDPYSQIYRERAEFQQLRDILILFAAEHDGHELYFINDSGDFPWTATNQYPWYEWREVIGPNTRLRDIDLPKNLIYDLNIASWQQAEQHLLASHRYNPENFSDDISLVRHGFEKVKQSN